ncbi:glycine--tRNA ligase subunit alpha [Buchnera aphidicola]|uniref:Glycine--tRNA ligase alpha subunit n=1 Tax=Buchnera aphidicola (Cinara cf. splendens/pseudotsugae 3390) TaxID=2518980 RepID=A0A451CWF1_9GAMM|nr:glycine--tRNA ligase subunit alpha [Buchnera aphidicola]VFP77662.1 Glycine--tRNA ligase alpha subunit [Buchnera aphidicola (Cinara cf. splendens/pseudotsugae 3390)]
MSIHHNTFYKTIYTLQKFWRKHNCIILQPLDISIGAATFHHHTFFSILKKKSSLIAYLQPSRRPLDGRYTNHPNRLQHYFQFQVIMKPAPNNIQKLYLSSLKKIGMDIKNNDIRFMEDNWENPTLGASGLGWEVWLNGMEISQITYFQQMGGITCNQPTIEVTYGLERISMHLQNINNIYDILWDTSRNTTKTKYSDIFLHQEQENSSYNFEFSDTKQILKLFTLHIQEANRLINLTIPLSIPAYEQMLHAIHYFNLLDCKKILSTTDRTEHILNIRKQIKKIAIQYIYNQNKE